MNHFLKNSLFKGVSLFRQGAITNVDEPITSLIKTPRPLSTDCKATLPTFPRCIETNNGLNFKNEKPSQQIEEALQASKAEGKEARIHDKFSTVRFDLRNCDCMAFNCAKTEPPHTALVQHCKNIEACNLERLACSNLTHFLCDFYPKFPAVNSTQIGLLNWFKSVTLPPAKNTITCQIARFSSSCSGGAAKTGGGGGCGSKSPCTPASNEMVKTCGQEDKCPKVKSPCDNKKESKCPKPSPCAPKKKNKCKKPSPCGKKEDKCAKKKDPCGEDPCAKNLKEKIEDICADNKEEFPCNKEVEPCGKKQQQKPKCGGSPPPETKACSPCSPKKEPPTCGAAPEKPKCEGGAAK